LQIEGSTGNTSTFTRAHREKICWSILQKLINDVCPALPDRILTGQLFVKLEQCAKKFVSIDDTSYGQSLKKVEITAANRWISRLSEMSRSSKL
jgi:hypothetical protein